MNWQENLLSTPEQIRELILQTRRIAVLGIKTEAQADQPSVYVPMYIQKAGLEINHPLMIQDLRSLRKGTENKGRVLRTRPLFSGCY